mmetsp:Transcript_19061/g.31233  ORF Transcript_19061/g.31233 Transcript_19061/m.31233 type:complete len:201 (-) Transcript_19061:306-908(-)|eukprot:CAMPEP_0184652140 /NCGR_PEP_ID=MMETSP0308-20130426/9827_1 /TAXON_ID=38269 /ORGANISM="Gloeochaete witrockiana, Strain SAG 46.84" /LENGTH=200 /DNA_ID=CAMNT_0027086831 /DNA_START=134 /DNA_END=736 /DNA_ORIENTATION=-
MPSSPKRAVSVMQSRRPGRAKYMDCTSIRSRSVERMNEVESSPVVLRVRDSPFGQSNACGGTERLRVHVGDSQFDATSEFITQSPKKSLYGGPLDAISPKYPDWINRRTSLIGPLQSTTTSRLPTPPEGRVITPSQNQRRTTLSSPKESSPLSRSIDLESTYSSSYVPKVIQPGEACGMRVEQIAHTHAGVFGNLLKQRK